MRYRYCILLILVSVAYTIGSVQQTWGDYSTNVIDYDSLKVIAVTFILKHFQNEKNPCAWFDASIFSDNVRY